MRALKLHLPYRHFLTEWGLLQHFSHTQNSTKSAEIFVKDVEGICLHLLKKSWLYPHLPTFYGKKSPKLDIRVILEFVILFPHNPVKGNFFEVFKLF